MHEQQRQQQSSTEAEPEPEPEEEAHDKKVRQATTVLGRPGSAALYCCCSCISLPELIRTLMCDPEMSVQGAKGDVAHVVEWEVDGLFLGQANVRLDPKTVRILVG